MVAPYMVTKIQDFLDSRRSVLVLIGPVGCGKRWTMECLAAHSRRHLLVWDVIDVDVVEKTLTSRMKEASTSTSVGMDMTTHGRPLHLLTGAESTLEDKRFGNLDMLFQPRMQTVLLVNDLSTRTLQQFVKDPRVMRLYLHAPTRAMQLRRLQELCTRLRRPFSRDAFGVLVDGCLGDFRQTMLRFALGWGKTGGLHAPDQTRNAFTTARDILNGTGSWTADHLRVKLASDEALASFLFENGVQPDCDTMADQAALRSLLDVWEQQSWQDGNMQGMMQTILASFWHCRPSRLPLGVTKVEFPRSLGFDSEMAKAQEHAKQAKEEAQERRDAHFFLHTLF
jgi:hypothetical protein